VLDELAEIPVCTAYRHAGDTLHELPADGSVLEACEPVYETLPGWQAATAGLREFSTLPPAAQRYVDRLGELAGCPIGLVSTGPDREHTISARGARSRPGSTERRLYGRLRRRAVRWRRYR